MRSTDCNMIYESSSVAIGLMKEGSGNVAIVTSSKGSNTVSSMLGVVVNSYSFYDCNTQFSINNASSVTIGCTTTGSGNVILTALSSGNVIASSVLGIALHSYSWLTSGVVRLTTGGHSHLSISCNTSGSDVVNMVTSTGNFRNIATAVLGVVTYAFSSSSKTGSSKNVFSAEHSVFTIACSAASNGTVAMSTNSSSFYLASTVLGLVMYSQPHSSTLEVGSNTSKLQIYVMLTNGATSVTHTYSAASTGGLLLKGNLNTVLELHQNDPSILLDSVPSANSAMLDVWIGLQRNGQLFVEAPNVGVVAGVAAKRFVGVSNKTTSISLCRDDVSNLPSATGKGISLGTSPPVEGVAVNEVTGWQLGSNDMCTNKVATLQAMLSHTLNMTLHEWFPTKGTPSRHASQLTPSQSPTSSGTHSLSESIPPHTSLSTSHSMFSAVTKTSTQSNEDAFSTSLALTSTYHRTPSLTTELSTQPAQNKSDDPIPVPPPKPSVHITSISVLMPNNEAAATVVLSTAGASGAVASTFGSSGAGVVVTAGSSVRMLECGFTEDDPRPARFELPIQFAVGNGTTRYFAGAVLAHTVVQCVLIAAPVLLWRQMSTKDKRSKLVQYMSMVFCGAHPFFTPAILGACSTVLFNDDDRLSLAVAGASALVVTAIHGVLVLAVHRGPVNGLLARRRV